MDIAGGIFVGKSFRHRCATVAFEAMTFRKPVYVGDVVSVFTDTVRVGCTSVTVRVEAWVTRSNESQMFLVTDGTFTYVAIDEHGKPTPVKASG
jgi:acyl-CoA thioesterase YciA